MEASMLFAAFSLFFFFSPQSHSESIIDGRVNSAAVRALPRPISAKPGFRHIVYRRIAKQTNYSAAHFLTDPAIRDDFDLQALSPASQQHYLNLRKNILSKQDKFNPQLLTALIKSLSTEETSVDVESLIQMILMDLSASAAADLKAMLNSMKEARKSTEALRELATAEKSLLAHCERDPNSCGAINLNQLRADLRKLQITQDSLQELSKSVSLRLQKNMERREKIVEMLSNILKIMDETTAPIIANVK